MSDSSMRIVPAEFQHLGTLKTWFLDREKAYDWCGPGLRYPFTNETFLEDIHWKSMPAYSLVNDQSELIGFGQYYAKALKCYQALNFEKAEYPPGHSQFDDIDFLVCKEV